LHLTSGSVFISINLPEYDAVRTFPSNNFKNLNMRKQHVGLARNECLLGGWYTLHIYTPPGTRTIMELLHSEISHPLVKQEDSQI
jgi:hypothetical protein